jgi:hypothetical protein
VKLLSVSNIQTDLLEVGTFVATASVVRWSEFLATDPEVRVRIPALPHFSEK